MIWVFNETTIGLDRFLNEKVYNGYVMDPQPPIVRPPNTDVFAAYPPQGARVVPANLTVVTADVATITFFSATCRFNAKLQAHDVHGAYFRDADGTQAEGGGDGVTYHRVLGEVNFSDENQTARLWATLGDAAFSEAPILWNVVNDRDPTGRVRDVLTELRKKPIYKVR